VNEYKDRRRRMRMRGPFKALNERSGPKRPRDERLRENTRRIGKQ